VGPAEDVLAKLNGLELPAEAKALCDTVSQVVAEVRAAAPDLMVTLDPGESHGFEYQTGTSFTLFARGVRGELGRGGRYDTGAGETAVGFTLYLDSLMRGLPPASGQSSLFLPFGTAIADGRRLRDEGWQAVQGLEAVVDDRAEAKRLGCTHIYSDGAATPLT
jgi:ATP phosphoribosyltransferase regulatory subunit